MSKQAEYSKRCYQKYKEKRKAEIRSRRKSLVLYVQEYKRTQSCVRCGESEPCCLDFHHIDPTTKSKTISSMARQGVSLETLHKEISKCELLCANCHRRYHHGPLVQWEDASFAPKRWGFDSAEVHQF